MRQILTLSRFLGMATLTICLLFIPNVYAEQNSEYQLIEWTDLMPADDLEALMNPPDIISQIEDGSAQDSIGGLDAFSSDDPLVSRFQAALTSTRVITEFANKKVKLPGFIVPLEGEDQLITEFFIVPFFGACLHLPPPPPNQILHVSFEQGIELPNLQAAFWFEGTLALKNVSNDMGASAYAMQINQIIPYEE